MTTGYCVYQDGYAIFGTGWSEAEAIADSLEWRASDPPPVERFVLDDGDVLDDSEAPPTWATGQTRTVDSRFYIGSATARLIHRVEQCGGDIAYERNADGHLDLVDIG